jgi:hypothetical protein
VHMHLPAADFRGWLKTTILYSHWCNLSCSCLSIPSIVFWKKPSGPMLYCCVQFWSPFHFWTLAPIFQFICGFRKKKPVHPCCIIVMRIPAVLIICLISNSHTFFPPLMYTLGSCLLMAVCVEKHHSDTTGSCNFEWGGGVENHEE